MRTAQGGSLQGHEDLCPGHVPTTDLVHHSHRISLWGTSVSVPTQGCGPSHDLVLTLSPPRRPFVGAQPCPEALCIQAFTALPGAAIPWLQKTPVPSLSPSQHPVGLNPHQAQL